MPEDFSLKYYQHGTSRAARDKQHSALARLRASRKAKYGNENDDTRPSKRIRIESGDKNDAEPIPLHKTVEDNSDNDVDCRRFVVVEADEPPKISHLKRKRANVKQKPWTVREVKEKSFMPGNIAIGQAPAFTEESRRLRRFPKRRVNDEGVTDNKRHAGIINDVKCHKYTLNQHSKALDEAVKNATSRPFTCSLPSASRKIPLARHTRPATEHQLHMKRDEPPAPSGRTEKTSPQSSLRLPPIPTNSEVIAAMIRPLIRKRSLATLTVEKRSNSRWEVSTAASRLASTQGNANTSQSPTSDAIDDSAVCNRTHSVKRLRASVPGIGVSTSLTSSDKGR